MYTHSIFSVLALSLAALYGGIGLVHLVGPRFLRNAYAHWDYPEAFRLVTGVLEIVAAVLLAEPELRAWGIALAAIVTFGAVITLLRCEQYLHAVPAVLMMVALVPATLAVPVTHYDIHYLPAIESAAVSQRLDVP